MGPPELPKEPQQSKTNDPTDMSQDMQHEQQEEQEKAEKIDAHEELEKVGEKSNTYFLIIAGVIILIILLIISIPKIFFPTNGPLTIEELHNENLKRNLDPEKGYLFNGFSFVLIDDSWFTRFEKKENGQQYNVQLRYGARQVQDIPIKGDYRTTLKYNATYITFDPTLGNLSYVALAAADISGSLQQVLGITPVAACTKNETRGCRDRPIVTCEESESPVIMLHQSKTPGITAIGSCIIVEGEGFDLVRGVDRLLLGWYGIMQ